MFEPSEIHRQQRPTMSTHINRKLNCKNRRHRRCFALFSFTRSFLASISSVRLGVSFPLIIYYKYVCVLIWFCVQFSLTLWRWVRRSVFHFSHSRTCRLWVCSSSTFISNWNGHFALVSPFAPTPTKKPKKNRHCHQQQQQQPRPLGDQHDGTLGTCSHFILFQFFFFPFFFYFIFGYLHSSSFVHLFCRSMCAFGDGCRATRAFIVYLSKNNGRVSLSQSMCVLTCTECVYIVHSTQLDSNQRRWWRTRKVVAYKFSYITEGRLFQQSHALTQSHTVAHSEANSYVTPCRSCVACDHWTARCHRFVSLRRTKVTVVHHTRYSTMKEHSRSACVFTISSKNI